MVFAAILAGGTGSRMQREMPKQFLPIGGKPIIVHTLIKFFKASSVDSIYIGVHKDWTDYMDGLLKEYFPSPEKPVRIICGGADRYGTLLNLLYAVEADYGEDEGHIFVTHDSVRPFVTVDMIEKSICEARRCGACNTVVGATDTIVVSDDGLNTSDMPDRSRIYMGQSPQSFRLSLFKELVESLTEEERATLTDACKIFIMRDKPVSLIKGDVSNFKITTKGDYDIASAMAGEYLEGEDG